jgi:hypothetical protein
MLTQKGSIYDDVAGYHSCWLLRMEIGLHIVRQLLGTGNDQYIIPIASRRQICGSNESSRQLGIKV